MRINRRRAVLLDVGHGGVAVSRSGCTVSAPFSGVSERVAGIVQQRGQNVALNPVGVTSQSIERVAVGVGRSSWRGRYDYPPTLGAAAVIGQATSYCPLSTTGSGLPHWSSGCSVPPPPILNRRIGSVVLG